MTGCSEDLTSSGSDDEIKPGDPVLFAPYLSGRAMTRATDVSNYHDASANYAFTYEMYKYNSSAVLVASGPQIYWPDNQIAYAFMAKAGSTTLAENQDSYEKFLLQDQLVGYGAIASTDNIEALNYRTCVDWKAANAAAEVATADQKKIPIYLKHLRSRITVILKAGEGVSRDDLANTNYLEAKIYSYSGETTTEISPWATSTTIDYTAGDYGGAANGVSTTQYTAIVEPYDYQANNTKPIAQIKLSNQTFKFLVGNETAVDKRNYNLTAGKHLIITATLARGDAQKVLLTAQVVPWTEVSTDATVGDDGLVGSTTDIDSRAGLLAFLSGDDNKAGNIANITADINLEEGGAWTPQPLNCTMKLNNHTISTSHPVFSTIGALGIVEGGTISVSGDATVNAAVATSNLGTIKDVTVCRESTGKASQGGLVVTNSGTISNCTSTLPVHGTSGFVGGIAKESVYSTIGSMPVIENCTVDARVDGEDGTSGGGIVGQAVGRVSGNTFAYGITLNQDANNFKNIVQAKADSHQLRAYDNKWPTKADNSIGDHSSNNSNTTTATKYDATIDNWYELWKLLSVSSNNQDGNNYRVNSDFSVVDYTDFGYWHVNITVEYAKFHLDGNGKNITTDPRDLLLFANVRSSVSTNLYVNGELAYPTQ